MKLKIKKLQRKRGGKLYYTYQFIKGNKVSNHMYNSAQTRDKMLSKFIEDIKSDNFEVV